MKTWLLRIWPADTARRLIYAIIHVESVERLGEMFLPKLHVVVLQGSSLSKK
jgi:hypothetical protein